MKKVIRLTESDLTRIVKRVIKESEGTIKVKVGDIYKITNPNGTHVRFKITKEDKNVGSFSYMDSTYFYGIILGVFGKFQSDPDYRDVRVGDQIEISFADDGSDGLSWYLPSTNGYSEAGSGLTKDVLKKM